MTPPPLTVVMTSKVSPMSAMPRDRLAAARCWAVTKETSDSLPLTVNLPLPGRRKTRAIALLRRPVP